MSIEEIYIRLEFVMREIRSNPDDENYLLQCESELSYLEQVRELFENSID